MPKKPIFIAMKTKVGFKMNRVQFNCKLKTLETNLTELKLYTRESQIWL